MRKLPVYFLLFLLIISCNQKPKSKKSEFTFILPDTSITHQPNIFYEIKKHAVEELNIQKLEFGKDSFELRLWTKAEATNIGEVIIIKKTNNQWTCLDVCIY